MAVVHVSAPAEVNPCAIEAELTRAIHEHRNLPMTAEVSLADELNTQPARGARKHGFVVALTLYDEIPAGKVARRLQKTTRKALRRRFGHEVTTKVSTDMTPAALAAYWCTFRGTPHRPY